MKMSRSRRWKNSRLGKVICRLAGEERGLVMMEYVIIAILVAAACVVAVAMFGKNITAMFGAATIAVTGDHSGAQKAVTDAQAQAPKDAKDGADYHGGMHK